MTQIRFYATGHDISTALSLFEEKNRIKYIATSKMDFGRRYNSYSGLPDLGKSTSDTGSTSSGYLISCSNTIINIRRVIGSDEVFEFLDQLINPDTIIFVPSGRRGDNVILCGNAGTSSNSNESLKLFRSLEKEIKKNFTKIGGYWVGPEALYELKSGLRLTISLQSPPDFDLSPPKN